MSANDDQVELLFFDTFSHPDNSEDLNLDLVQFPCAVVVHEIRVVPLGTRIIADVPGGVRLGATNPSSFKLELFVNNLSKPNASTFEKLGLLEYEANVDIQMKPDIKVATDGLIIKGWYQTITLAVYGALTTVKQDNSPPPPPPTHLRSKPQSILPLGLEKPEFDSMPQSLAASQKAALERTSEWAEKAVAFIQPVLVQPPPKGQPAEPMHSPVGSPPINPRDIPLEHRGGTRDPRDPPRDIREKETGKEGRDRDFGGPTAEDSYDERKEGRRESSDGNEITPGDRYRSRSKSDTREDEKDFDMDSRDHDEKSRDKDFWSDRKSDEVDKGRDSDRERDKERDAVSRMSPRDGGSRKRGDSFTKSGSPLRSPSPGLPAKQSPAGRRARTKTPDSIAHLNEETEPGEIPEPNVDLYGSIDHENSPEAMELYQILSDGEIQEGDGDYSQISSDENNIQFEDETPMGDLGDWEAVEDAWNYASIASFNPYQCDLAPLETFTDPSLTLYELEKQKLFIMKDDNIAMPPAASQLLKMVQTFQNSAHHQAWIEAMEQVPGLVIPGVVHLVNKTEQKEVLELLIDWTFEGLDLNKAMAQPETAYKVRHLKMGIRVAGALCSCDSYVSFRMLSREVQHKLLDLYTSPNMSTSIKVLIINALDQSTRLKEGLDWLLGRHHLQVGSSNHISRTEKANAECVPNAAGDPGNAEEPMEVKHEQMEMDEEKGEATSKAGEMYEQSVPPSGYKRLVEVMLQKQLVRPMVALTNLVRKVHAYEVLLKLMNSVDTLVENMPSTDHAKSRPVNVDDTADSAMEMDVTEPPVVLDAVLEVEIETISRCLEEIARILSNADNIIGPPKCTLPNPTRFELTKKPQDTLSNLYHMFNACRLLECIFVLLSSLATCNHSSVFLPIKHLLMLLLTQQSGLLYLSFRVDTINGILRTLTQNADYSPDEERELTPQNHLGLIMIYYLQTMQHIDQLKEYQAKDASDKELDDAAVLAVLHNLYSMTFTPQGKEAMVYVFTLNENISVLLPFIEMTGDELKDSQIHRSVCFAYSIMVLVFIVRYSEHVQWLEIYGHKLLNFIEHESKTGKMDEKVAELQEWLQPMKSIVAFNIDAATVQELVLQLKQYTDDMSEMPKGVVTILRILKYMAIGPEFKDADHVEELKYKYILVELFGANCLPLFVTILQKVRDLLLLPWQQGFPQSVSERTFILALVQPILALMKAILSYLISACGNTFKDVTCLPSLLSIHTLLCSVSHTGVLAPEIQQIQNDIIDTLMAFTQPTLTTEESEEALCKSLWSMMVKEVLKYTLTAPYTFLSGLIVISEMLPLPLPIQTRENLSPQELVEIVNNRKRWSAHLHPHTSEIQNIIRNLSGTSCQPLHQLLRRVCWQLADLAVPTALTIVRSLLDTLLESMDASRAVLSEALQLPQPVTELGSAPAVPPLPEVYSSSQTARVLNLLAFLMNQPPVKAAFLFLSRSGVKSDDKYLDVLSRLVVLLNIVSEAPSHVQAQESIVSIFQSLCDVEITLLMPECGVSPVQQLANGLPMKDQLSLICTGLLEHINNRDQKFSSILPSLRTLTLLMDHDYGFYYVKQAMEKLPSAFFNLFMQINATFSKDSSDCIATLSSAAECIQFLVALPGPPDGTADDQPAGLERTYTMSFADVREMLGWSLSEDILAHPLNDLDVLLCEYAKDEETLKAVYESVNAVVGILRSDEESVTRPDITEPVLVAPETLMTQFNIRTVYLVTDDEDDRLSATYWLSTPMGDESDHEQDLVRSDLITMASTYCPGLDLEGELKKGSTASDSSLTPKRKIRRITATRRSTDTINTSKMRGSGTGFVAPMRGRGFGRGGNNNRSDLFRSRPPNTSRPPSMHVDDFDKFMAQNQQGPPILAVGMNAPRRTDVNTYVASTNDAARGHGFEGGRGGFSNRGRFFNNPGNYVHRDDGLGRGGYRGVAIQRGGLQNPRGGGLIRGTATGPPIINRGSPSKTSPWGGRNTRQMYTLSGFGRGEVQHEQIERLDRRRDGLGTGGYGFMHSSGGGGGGSGGGGGVPWMEHKDREQEQRFMGPPPPMTLFQWRDRGRHQRTSTR